MESQEPQEPHEPGYVPAMDALAGGLNPGVIEPLPPSGEPIDQPVPGFGPMPMPGAIWDLADPENLAGLDVILKPPPIPAQHAVPGSSSDATRMDFYRDALVRLYALVQEINGYLRSNASKYPTIVQYGQETFRIVEAKSTTDKDYLDNSAATNASRIHFLEYVCSKALNIANEARLLCPVPRPLCSGGGGATFIRLTTYAPVMVMRASAHDVQYGEGALTLLHEVGHFVDWNGSFAEGYATEGCATEGCATEGYAAEGYTTDENPTIEQVNTARFGGDKSSNDLANKAQEIFADIFAIALGGPLAAIHLLNELRSIIFANQHGEPHDETYPSPEVGSAAIIAATRAFCEPEWCSAIADWWSHAGTVLATSGPLLEWANELVAEPKMMDLAQRATADPVFGSLKNAVARDAITFSHTGDARIPHDTIDAWRQSMMDGADLIALTDDLAKKGGASITSFPSVQALVLKWSKETPRPGPHHNLEWWPVIDAGGWTTKGPHSRHDGQ